MINETHLLWTSSPQRSIRLGRGMKTLSTATNLPRLFAESRTDKQWRLLFTGRIPQEESKYGGKNAVERLFRAIKSDLVVADEAETTSYCQRLLKRQPE